MSGENEKLYNKLSNYKSSSDFEGIWMDLEEKRHPKKRRGMIWFLGLSLGILIAGFLFTVLQKDDKQETAHLQAEESSLDRIHHIDGGLHSSDEIEMNRTSNKHLKIVANNNISSNSNEANLTTVFSQNKEEIHLSPNDKGIQNENLKSFSEYNKQHKYTKTSSNNFRDSRDVNIKLANNQSQTYKDLSNVKEVREASDIHYENMLRQWIDIQPLELVEGQLLNRRIPIEAPNLLPVTALKKAKLSPWQLSFISGYGLTDQRLESDGDEQWYQDRQQIEKSLDVLSVGLLIDYAINNRFSLRSGIEYYRQYLKSDQKLTNSTKVIIEDQVTKVIVDQNGIEREERGSIEGERLETSSYLRYTTFSNVDIPILMTYRFIGDQSNGLNLIIGPAIGISRKGKGEILSPSLDGFQSLETMELIKTQNLSLHTGIEVNKSLISSIGLGLGIFSKVSLSNDYKSTFQSKPIDLMVKLRISKAF